MPMRREPTQRPAPCSEKFRQGYSTWLTDADAVRLESVALALGWTHSRLLRWSFTATICRLEEAARANAALHDPPPQPKGKRKP